ncbi:MAG: SUKH-3 domain-containing protein [Gemmataceae bacterium]
MYNFSEEMMETLTAAGWYPGRQIDVSAWLEEITGCDFPICPLAVQLLSTFGGLTFQVATYETRKYPPPFTVDPTKKLHFDVEEYEPMIGERLTPFAVDEDDTGYFITPTGAFYGCHWECFERYGLTLPESFENAVLYPGRAVLIHEDKS